MENTSLDKLAHIANMSHGFQQSNVPQPSRIQPQNVSPTADDKRTIQRLAQQAKMKKMACTCCRQQKSKCDAHERHPLPCTQCAKKKLVCEVDATFRRRGKRAHLARIEQEFLELKRSFQDPLAAEDFYKTAPNLAAHVGSGSFSPGKTPVLSESPSASIQPSVISSREASVVASNITSSGVGQARSFPSNLASQLPHQYLSAQIPNIDFNLQSRMLPGSGQEIRGFISENASGVGGSQPQILDSQNPALASQAPARTETAQNLSFSRNGPVPVFIPDIPDHVLHCEEKVVESVVLSPHMIRELYLEYVRYYHPIMPLVDVMKGPERLHRLCPALFWVVMFVALRRYNEDKSLLLTLSPLVKNILAEISISPITRYNPTEDDEPILNACSVYSTQAFILYSLWPPLTSSLSADSSWVTIGTALFQGIRTGLHTAGQSLKKNFRQDSKSTQPSQDPLEQPSQQQAMAQEQTRTWIICNIVSENIATAFGFPAFVQFDFRAAQCCELPLVTRHAMEIAHFEDQVARALAMGTHTAGTVSIDERIALVKVLLKQLDDLEARLDAEEHASTKSKMGESSAIEQGSESTFYRSNYVKNKERGQKSPGERLGDRMEGESPANPQKSGNPANPANPEVDSGAGSQEAGINQPASQISAQLVAQVSAQGHRKLHYLVARVHLLTCYFLDAPRISSFELSKGLVRLFGAATALLTHVDACEAQTKSFVRYLPVVSVLHIWQAAFIVVKLAHSSLKSVLDVSQARSTYSAAIRLVARASVLKHDIAYRAAGIMRNMWSLLRTLDAQNSASLHLNITSRMTASVFFDCLSLLRDKVGMAKLNINTDVRAQDASGNIDEDPSSADESSDSENGDLAADQAQDVYAPGAESSKSTPGSTASSGRVKRHRRLSGVQDAESNARKIIRTIPLDPQPISASGRSSIFKVVNGNSGSSPNFSIRSANSHDHASPQPPMDVPNAVLSYPQQTTPLGHEIQQTTPQNGSLLYPVSDTSASLESNLFDMNNELLWKDVDSLMNDFGFPT